MKKLLKILIGATLIMIAALPAMAQQYQPMSGYGYRMNRLAVDSVFMVPNRDTTFSGTYKRAGALVFRTKNGDRTLYAYDGIKWINVSATVGTGIDTLMVQADSLAVVLLNGDTVKTTLPLYTPTSSDGTVFINGNGKVFGDSLDLTVDSLVIKSGGGITKDSAKYGIVADAGIDITGGDSTQFFNNITIKAKISDPLWNASELVGYPLAIFTPDDSDILYWDGATFTNKPLSVLETDPRFDTSAASSITNADIARWDSAGIGTNLANSDLTQTDAIRQYYFKDGYLIFTPDSIDGSQLAARLLLERQKSALMGYYPSYGTPTYATGVYADTAFAGIYAFHGGVVSDWYLAMRADTSSVHAVMYRPDGTPKTDTLFRIDTAGNVRFPHVVASTGDTLDVGVDDKGNLIIFPRSSGGGGIGQVIGVNGIGNVNDSTVYLDTSIAMTHKQFSDSLALNSVTVLAPLVLNSDANTLTADTLENDDDNLATQGYVLRHSGTGSLQKIYAGNNLTNVNDSTLRADTSTGHLATQYFVLNQGFLTSETDPIALAKTVTISNGYGILGGSTKALSTNPSFTLSADTTSATGLLSKSRANSTYLKLSGGTISGPILYSGVPEGASELVNKTYVDNLATGLSWKQAVKATTTEDITLSGEQTIDGVSIGDGDRVLVANQDDATENGIYVASSGAWSRASDNDSGTEIKGAAVYTVSGGTSNGGTQWVNTNSSTITVGSTDITFGIFGGGNTYTGSNGIALSGSDFHLDDDAFNTPTVDSTLQITGTGQLWGTLNIGLNPDYIVADTTSIDSIGIVYSVNNQYGDIMLGLAGSGNTINLKVGDSIVGSYTVSGSGASGVTSFNGRDGDVLPATGDYSFEDLSGKLSTDQDYATDVVPGTYNNFTVNQSGRITSASNVSYLTGNQTITLTGNITGSGSTSIATTIANKAVTYAKMQDVNGQRLLGRYSSSAGAAQEITIGSGLSLNSSTGVLSATGGGGTGDGTVTFVDLEMPSIFSVSGGPVINSGTFDVTFNSAAAGLVLATPAASSGVPGLRALASTDIPNLAASKITSGTFAVARLGTGTAGSGKYVDGGTGAWTSLPSINNATLTLATSGIATGSASFTANSSSNTTFTVNVPATNISIGSRTSTVVPILSSTGSDASIPAATTSLAGVMTAADKTKLDGISTPTLDEVLNEGNSSSIGITVGEVFTQQVTLDDGIGSFTSKKILATNSDGSIIAGNENNWIKNQTSQQTSSNFNISGDGVIGDDLTVGGEVTVTGSVTAAAGYESSDIRLKTILNAHPVITGIAGIQAKLYKKYVAPYGSNGLFLLHPDSVTQVGYIAQDVQKIMPYAVKEGDNGYLNLDYKQVFVAKIAALEQENADLKKRLEALEAKVQALLEK